MITEDASWLVEWCAKRWCEWNISERQMDWTDCYMLVISWLDMVGYVEKDRCIALRKTRSFDNDFLENEVNDRQLFGSHTEYQPTDWIRILTASTSGSNVSPGYIEATISLSFVLSTRGSRFIGCVDDGLVDELLAWLVGVAAPVKPPGNDNDMLNTKS